MSKKSKAADLRVLKMIDNTFIRGEHFSLLLEVAMTGKLRKSQIKSPNMDSLIRDQFIVDDGRANRRFHLLRRGVDCIANGSVLFTTASAYIVHQLPR